MPLPSLPADAWLRIFRNLPVESLSAVSEVNRELNRLVTDDSLFRRYLKMEPTDNRTSAALLYRRLEALHYPGETRMSVYSSPNKIPFCVVNNTLVLLDLEQAAMICFPAGYFIIPAVGVDDIQAALKSLLRVQSGNIVHVILPNGRFAFLYEIKGATTLSVLQEDTGTLYLHAVEGGLPSKNVLPRTELIAAGENAQWVGYYKSESVIVLIDWNTGVVVREVDMSLPGMRFVIGECPQIRGSCLIGVARSEEREDGTRLVARLFDGEEKVFHRDFEGVQRVLRSVDKKTYVVIARSQVPFEDINWADIGVDMEYRTYFHAFREESSGMKTWNGELEMDGYAELRENGRLIHCGVAPFSGYPRSSILDDDEFAHRFPNSCLWTELLNDGGTSVQRLPKRFFGIRPVWTRRVKGGTLALFVGEKQPTQVFLLKFLENQENEHPKFVRLEHWVMRNALNVHFVGEHYLVVATNMGYLFVRHYNYFCDAQGMLACSGEVESCEEDDDLDWTTILPCSREKKSFVERL